MNISKHSNGELNAVITIEVGPEDYQDRVANVIKKYQRTANVPGFRPGKVPVGMIKKMYGKAVLADELNNLLNDELRNYIVTNNLRVLGNPLPVNEEREQNLEDGKNFTFSYEVGMAPDFEVKLPSSAIPYYLLKVDDKMVDDDIADLRRRHGDFSNPEVSDEKSILYGEFEEMENGEVKAEGNKTKTTIAIEMIRDEEKRKPFLCLKKADTVTFNPLNTFNSEAEVSSMLRVKKEDPAMQSDYRFTVQTINQIDKADIGQELFDKVYGEGEVTSEEDFRGRIRADIAAHFERESDRKLRKDLRLKMIEENDIPLPDDFLMRMLRASAEKAEEIHDFEHQYYHLAEDLRWNLIQSRLAEKHNISVDDDEIMELARGLVRQQFAQYGINTIEPERLDELARNYIQSENSDRLENSIRDEKIFKILKSEIKLDFNELPYDDFVEKLNERTQHEAEHHHHA